MIYFESKSLCGQNNGKVTSEGAAVSFLNLLHRVPEQSGFDHWEAG